tara:strand:+ start:314 stop:613 length:300 start_codon:yes stop_codon:yes gene_type:complete
MAVLGQQVVMVGMASHLQLLALLSPVLAAVAAVLQAGTQRQQQQRGGLAVVERLELEVLSMVLTVQLMQVVAVVEEAVAQGVRTVALKPMHKVVQADQV